MLANRCLLACSISLTGGQLGPFRIDFGLVRSKLGQRTARSDAAVCFEVRQATPSVQERIVAGRGLVGDGGMCVGRSLVSGCDVGVILAAAFDEARSVEGSQESLGEWGAAIPDNEPKVRRLSIPPMHMEKRTQLVADVAGRMIRWATQPAPGTVGPSGAHALLRWPPGP